MKFAYGALLQPMVVMATRLANDHFEVSIDDTTGAVLEIRNRDDDSNMNWISSPSDAPWLPPSSRWGLGYTATGQLRRHYWSQPTKPSSGYGSHNGCVTYRYDTTPAEITVKRCLEGKLYTETYSFKNTGSSDLDLSEAGDTSFAIYTPVNDHYTNSTDSLGRRAHAHIWANGGSSSWIKATRMGGSGPHLGLVLTKGSLRGHSIESRNTITSSNTRGAILVHPELSVLEPGAIAVLEWTMFWHDEWDDFFSTAMETSNQFVNVNISSYSPTIGDEVKIEMRGHSISKDTLVNGDAVTCSGEHKCSAKFTAKGGESTIKISTSKDEDRREARVVIRGSKPMDNIIGARTKFIVSEQQFSSSEDDRDGAYLVYDNDANVIVTWDTASDRNAGRERVGMGVLIARWLLEHEDKNLESSLVKYYTFVCTQLQDDDGGAGDRLYDYPWIMQLHLLIAKLDLELPESVAAKTPIERFVATAERLYDQGAAEFYTIGLPILEGLRFLNTTAHRDTFNKMYKLFSKHVDTIAEKGIDYPASEVNYEQSIVAPAANMLLEFYRFTGNETWLKAAKPHFELLLRFGGRQADYHLHDISIRHWDGYWFGKDRMWGDTMPHYWSTLTAIAMHHYGKATEDDTFVRRANEVLKANLANFSADGKRGYCAWIYPRSVDGREGYYPDPYANDQDWALAHVLQLREDDAFDKKP